MSEWNQLLVDQMRAQLEDHEDGYDELPMSVVADLRDKIADLESGISKEDYVLKWA